MPFRDTLPTTRNVFKIPRVRTAQTIRTYIVLFRRPEKRWFRMVSVSLKPSAQKYERDKRQEDAQKVTRQKEVSSTTISYLCELA